MQLFSNSRVLPAGLLVCFLAGAAVCGVPHFCHSNVYAQQVRSSDVQLDLSVGQISDYTRSNWWRTTRDYNTKYHPWTPPGSLEQWKTEAEKIRTQILVSQGLWPLPEKTPLRPVIHGKIDCGDYTIEKVFFASRPGLYVTGNLYRPVGKTGKLPGVLCPHGHWRNGRFYDAGEKEAARQIASGAETIPEAARYPLQARMVHLARMGCVVFHYDMIDYADSSGIDHRTDFSSVQDGLWLLESMGLQTWNSIRALDFLCSLEDVDADRIAVTGASGGGTQTFILCAIDDRPAVAVPAVMVSTDMQGGCACENAPYLRIDTNNIAFAALFAPKPLGLTGADDWTIRLETRGLPELKRIYNYYGKAENVEAWVHPEFGHNYNSVSRKHMYAFLVKHLNLQNVSIEERRFPAKTSDELSVFDQLHPRPGDSADAASLRADWIRRSQETIDNLLLPENKKQYEKIVGSARNVLLGGVAPASADLTVSAAKPVERDSGVSETFLLVSRKDDASVIPVTVLSPAKPDGKILCWFDPRGIECIKTPSKAQAAMITKRLGQGTTIVLADIRGFGSNRPAQGKKLLPVNSKYYGYTFGYNRPLIASRVRDIAAVVVAAASRLENPRIELLGTGEAGSCVLLAQAICSSIVQETTVDLNEKSFSEIEDLQDPLFLPGALKYGGFAGLAAVSPCEKITIYGVNEPLRKKLVSMKPHVSQLELIESEWKPSENVQ